MEMGMEITMGMGITTEMGMGKVLAVKLKVPLIN
jgi:hypothetical protein